jgi:hypothetical protein
VNIGDQVHWTHVSTRGRTLSMTRREGTITAIDGPMATVRTSGKRQVQIAVARLRLDGERSQIDEFVEGVRQAARN